MNIVDCKCPNCGANIKIDRDGDAASCEYCGYSFLVSAAINNYGTYINKQVVNNVKQDNEWTYKTENEKGNNIALVGLCIMAIFSIIFLCLFMFKTI